MVLLTVPFLGTPVWMWMTFVTVVLGLLALDLGVLNRKEREIGVRQSLRLSAFYILLGIGFSIFVWMQLGGEAAGLYLTAFVVEKTLALDNVFVIALIFAHLSIPPAFQHRVLFWGILGVIILRGLMIGLGATLVAQYGWILYVFAAFLILTGIKMLVTKEADPDLSQNRVLRFLRRHLAITDTLRGNAFFVRETLPGTQTVRTLATPLFLALILIEFADLVFAIDSVPAVFAITTDPFLVYTSNIFAILGLRALYFALAAILHRFHYLRHALAVLLVFIGSKVFLADALGWQKFPAEWSLGITFGILITGVAVSLWRTRPGAEGAALPPDGPRL